MSLHDLLSEEVQMSNGGEPTMKKPTMDKLAQEVPDPGDGLGAEADFLEFGCRMLMRLCSTTLTAAERDCLNFQAGVWTGHAMTAAKKLRRQSAIRTFGD